MAKREPVNFLQNLSSVTERMQESDQQVSQRRDGERGELSSIPIEQISKREADTRPLNQAHVEGLAESIAALGLIEPLVLDQDKVLLAGGHRLASIEYLKSTDIDLFNQQFPGEQVPVRIMPFVAKNDPERALQIEVAENEHRRDYTPAEVRVIAAHLKAAGYRDSGGRPKKGEKALMPALSVVIGKNRRTIHRYLSEPNKEKTTTDVSVYLKKASKALQLWQKQVKKMPHNQEFLEQLPEILEMIDTAQSGKKES